MTRETLVVCPSCNGRGKHYWNLGISSCTCGFCNGLSEVTLEKSISFYGMQDGYSKDALDRYVEENLKAMGL